jgi:hypothetical protein
MELRGKLNVLSRPTRGAWIETGDRRRYRGTATPTDHAGSYRLRPRAASDAVANSSNRHHRAKRAQTAIYWPTDCRLGSKAKAHCVLTGSVRWRWANLARRYGSGYIAHTLHTPHAANTVICAELTVD